MSSSPFYTNEVFGNEDALIDWVKSTAESIGFLIVKGRSKTDRGYKYSIELLCSRYGTSAREGLEDELERQTSTAKINCPFRLLAKFHKRKNGWILNVKCLRHNHVFVDSFHGFSQAMRLKENEFVFVKQMTEQHVAPRIILSAIKESDPNNVSGIKTIYNAQDKIRRANRGDLTPIQLLLVHLQRQGYTYYPRINDHTNELDEIFFVHPTSYALWTTYPEIMLMDSTYNTTMFKLPFFIIVGVTPTNTTFSMAFSFLDKEKKTNFKWVLECVKLVIQEQYYPRVIVTDRDLALLGACEEEFPNANRLLCRWHINQNVLKHCRPKFDSLKEYESVRWTWELMVTAPTEDVFTHYYEHLQDLLAQKPDVFQYFRNWLQDYDNMFVSYITDQYRSFGQTTTCRVESQHALLKLYLGNTQSSLDTLLCSVDKIIAAQETAIRASLNTSKIKKLHACKDKLFSELRYNVSRDALLLLLAESQRDGDPHQCDHQLRSIYGLPCYHQLYYLKANGLPIPLGFVDNFWRTLSVPWPVVRNTQESEEPQGPEEPEYFSCQDDVQKFQSVYTRASSFVKKNMLNRLRGIYAPESVSAQQPAVKESNRARPSAKDNKSKSKPNIPDLNEGLNEEPPTRHRRSYTKPKKVPEVNKESARHSSYVGEPSNVPDLNEGSNEGPSEGDLRHHLYVPDYFSEYCMTEIPLVFRRWIMGIFNVEGDGNCGYRAVAVGLGGHQEMWPRIRALVRAEVDNNEEVYRELWGNSFTSIRNSMNWFRGAAPRRCWMTMPELGVVIATSINRPIVCITNSQSLLCLPLRGSPDSAEILSPVVILRVGNNECAHFVLAFLDEDSPLPYNHPQWRHFRNAEAAPWEHVFAQRQRMLRYT